VIEVQRLKRYNNFLLSVRIFCVDKIIERNNYTVTIHGGSATIFLWEGRYFKFMSIHVVKTKVGSTTQDVFQAWTFFKDWLTNAFQKVNIALPNLRLKPF